MNQKAQVRCDLVIDSPIELVWSILQDSTRLPQWLSNVTHTDILSERTEAGDEVRRCAVDLVGQKGQLVERCVDFVPMQKIAYRIEEDTFGFQRLLTELGYVMQIEASGTNATHIRLEYRYRTKGLLTGLLNLVMIKPQWKQLCGDMLKGLKALVENTNALPVA